MRPGNKSQEKRRGALAVLFALLLPILLIMVSFTTDVAMMASARGQLGTASDAAALAGAARLISSNRLSGSSNLSSEMSSARAKAVEFAGYNRTLNKSTYIDSNPSNSPSKEGDVVIGYLDPLRLADPSVALSTDPSMASLFNSVQVTHATIPLPQRSDPRRVWPDSGVQRLRSPGLLHRHRSELQCRGFRHHGQLQHQPHSHCPQR